MSQSIEVCLNKATENEILNHLLSCDADFVPPLSSRIEIKRYALKIKEKAMRFEAWYCSSLVGMVAAYFNSQQNTVFITSVSLLKSHQGRGIASKLMRTCIENAKNNGFQFIELEVDGENDDAFRIYKKLNFKKNKIYGRTTLLKLNI